MPSFDITEFGGLWNRGGDENTPPDHFTDCRNLKFDLPVSAAAPGVNPGKIGTREGSIAANASSFGSIIVRSRIYKPNSPWTLADGPRPIILDAAGRLIDTKDPTVALVTNANATDFSMVNMFGRAYISLSDGKRGLNGVNLYVYNGGGAAGFRAAGGAAPVTAPVVAMSVGTGNLGVGKYLFRYAYETDTGFITPPSVMDDGDSFGSYSANVDVTAGPAGTAAIWIIATKAIPTGTYNGNDEGYPYFFVSREANATATINVTFFDEELVESADYLFNVSPTIPAGVVIYEYSSRLMLGGEYSQPAVLRGSEPGEPEAFSSTSGLQTVDPADVGGIRSLAHLGNTLFIGGSTTLYNTQDNGDTVSTWDIDQLSNGVGAEHYGISQIYEEFGAESNYFLMATHEGLIIFNGIPQQPALTWKVEDIWKRINKAVFYRVEVHIDPEQKLIYVLCPIDSSSTANCILVGNYSRGLNAEAMRWVRWQFPDNDTRTMSVFRDYTEGKVTLIYSGTKVYQLLDFSFRDDGVISPTAINSYFELGPKRFGPMLSTYNKIEFDCNGISTGGPTLVVSFTKKDGTITTLTSQNITGSRYFSLLVNALSEWVKFKFTSNSLNSNFRINWISIFGSKSYSERPRV